jgi:aminoglycoside phosphotransferase family enzyme/predicted kinase
MGVPLDDQVALQARVLNFLGDPRTHRGTTVRRIDTHASSIFLTGERALKIKRAVRLPYLDYSALARRKAACEAELAINQPNAPQIYRSVVAITQGEHGHLAIGGRGTPVEWALDMKRFDEAMTLDRIAQHDEIEPGLAIGITDAILKSHHTAERSQAPWSDTVAMLIRRNIERFRSVQGISAEQIDRLELPSLAAFDRVHDLSTKRRDGGFVRRCHGDLHLANIVLLDEGPVLFDAIEFDPAMATTDVLYDLAFPVMDLVHFRQSGAANVVLNRYLSRSEDANLDALQALPLFMSIRAAIRANVLFTQAERSQDQAANKCAGLYFALAGNLIAPKPARLVAVGGSSGTGKSALARALASYLEPAPGAVVLRSDVIRKTMFGVDENARLPAEAYRPEVTQRVYKGLVTTASRVLAQGCSVIVDAAYLRESERDAIHGAATQSGVRFDGLFLRADLAARLERIAVRRNDASDADAEVAKMQERLDIGALGDWTTIDASGSPQQTRDAGVRALAIKPLN